MKILFYSANAYEIPYIQTANNNQFNLTFLADRLNSETTHKAIGFDAISIFSADDASLLTLEKLNAFGVKYIALRSAGYNNVNLNTAKRLGMKVANVPAYSPNAIAEHATALLLTLNRKIIVSNHRIKRFNFDINDLVGFDLKDKVVGIIGTGRIGSIMTKIMNGFDAKLLLYDIVVNEALTKDFLATYVDLHELCTKSDIISLHVPLNSQTHYMINQELIKIMKPGVFIINTARGAVIDTEDLLNGIENEIIGGYAADVYENEKTLFFRDRSQEIPSDELFIKLNSMPNVLITGHHAFLTKEALTNIAQTTIHNIKCWHNKKESENDITDYK